MAIKGSDDVGMELVIVEVLAFPNIGANDESRFRYLRVRNLDFKLQQWSYRGGLLTQVSSLSGLRWGAAHQKTVQLMCDSTNSARNNEPTCKDAFW